jgi:hypothetical protein
MKNPINKWLFKHRKRIQLTVLLMQFIIVTATFIRLTELNKKQFFVCRPDLNRMTLLCIEQ